MRRLLVPGLLLALLASPALGLPKPKEKWIEVRTENFTLFSNAPERLTRQVGLNLERLRESLRLLTKMKVHSPLPSYIYVFRGTGSFRRYVDTGDRNSPTVGIFLGHPDGNYVAIDAGPDQNPYEIIYHEYIHYYLNNNSTGVIPTWFNEGLAEFYSTFRADENRVEIGRHIDRHVFWLRANRPLPLDRLFSITTESPEYNEGNKSGVFYAQSWALVHYLYTGARALQLAEFLGSLDEGAEMDEAFRSTFATDYDGLQSELDQYIRNGRYTYRMYTFKELEVSEEVHVETMTRAEMLYRLGDYLAHSGGRLDEAREHFGAALEVDGGHAGALAGLAYLLDLEERYDEASALYSRSIRADAGRFMTHLMYGRNLVARYEATSADRIELDGPLPPLLAQARVHFRAGIELNPGLGPAYAAFGYTFVYDPGDVEEGIRALRTALRLMPRDEDSAYNLMVLYLKNGQAEAAADLERNVLRRSTDPELRLQARETLLRDRLRVANELIGQGRMSEGNEVLREVRDKTGDAVLRDELDALIVRNSAVDRYNRAVDLANAGEWDRAEELLVELRDEGVEPALSEAVDRLLADVRRVRKGGP